MMEPLSFIPSRASQNKKVVNFEKVVFESYKSKKPKSKSLVSENKEDKEEKRELNMKQTKHEIIKLGMSGLEGQQKEEAKINLLIKLGAKPPKNKNKNYKLLQQERKKAKEEKAKQMDFSQLGKNKIGKSTAKGKSFDRKRRKENLLSVYGKVKRQ
ncbi:uncharacterized protein C1orf131 homolog [Diorhabda sublineata]|uniref:uncharacterized protein C1orf131 homolog n=1 Tax=Diorhabda sublineata TaxID=1163346 RepID=UPI0024E08E2F|nr:uncharacterized protein C1orf131 homolog [Diorhabda sublineata]